MYIYLLLGCFVVIGFSLFFGYERYQKTNHSTNNPIVGTFLKTATENTHSPYLIGICGGSGSGKTYISNTIVQAIEQFTHNKCSVTVVHQDCYYKGGDDFTNYDVPAAIDFPLMIAQLTDLMNNKEINCPIYNFHTHCRSNQYQKIIPAKIIIVEGILIFTDVVLRNLLHMKIFIQADEPTQIFRRILRDVKERQRTIDEIQVRYEKDVWPAYKNYILPSSKYADIIVNNFNNCFVGPQIILSHIIQIIDKINNTIS